MTPVNNVSSGFRGRNFNGETKHMKHFVVFAPFLLCLSTAFAASDGNQFAASDGNRLLKDCQAAVRAEDNGTLLERDVIPATYCHAVIHGVSDLAQVWGRVEFPTGYSEMQGVRVVTTFLEHHPEILNKRDTLLVITALRDAFPKKEK